MLQAECAKLSGPAADACGLILQVFPLGVLGVEDDSVADLQVTSCARERCKAKKENDKQAVEKVPCTEAHHLFFRRCSE